jgi:hypothetical protein
MKEIRCSEYGSWDSQFYKPKQMATILTNKLEYLLLENITIPNKITEQHVLDIHAIKQLS